MNEKLQDANLMTVVGTSNETVSQDAYVFPCTIVQKTCWYLDQMSPGTAANNIAVRFRLDGRLKVDALEQALLEIASRHEVLRTRFIVREGQPAQLVEAEPRFPLAIQDLRDGPEHERQRRADDISDDEARTGFDLGTGPLIRGQLLRLYDESYILLITMHHIIGDGWSVGIFTDELGAAYEDAVCRRNSSLPDLPLQYADYACWQEQWIQDGHLEAGLAFWKTKLDGFVPLAIQTDFPRPGNGLGSGLIRSRVLSRTLTDRVRELSDKQGCTLFTTMFAAFAALMRHESGLSDLTIRTQVAGRSRVELEPLIGWFVNSIILRVEAQQNQPFLRLMQHVRALLLETLPFQDVPFERVMESVRPNRKSPQQMPFQVNFIFQRDFVKPWKRAGIQMTAVPSRSVGAFVDLNFFMVERADGWRASVDVNTDVFRPEMGDHLLQAFEMLLQAIAHDPSVVYSQLELPRRLPPAQTTGAQKTAEEKHEAPRSAVEREVASIWQEVLGVSELYLDSNFFDLGGHSLLAVQLLAKIRERFGHAINLADLFVEPTVRRMVEVIKRPGLRSEVADFIYVQPLGHKPPIYMVGGDHWFRPLARRLDVDRPFIGMSLQRYESRTEPTPFEEIAEDLSNELIKRGRGPFILSGWCVDAAIAFEIAQKLLQKRQKVEIVVLLDAVNPSYRRKYNSMRSALGRALKRSYDVGFFKDLGAKAGRFIPSLKTEIQQDPVIVQADPDRQEFRRLLYIAEQSYSPKPIPCPVLLIRTELDATRDSDLGWSAVSPNGFEVVEVAGDHINIFREPLVATLATVINDRLSRTESTVMTATGQA